MTFGFHFGEVTKNCSPSETSDALAGKAPYQPKTDALYPFDTERLVPSCISKDANQQEIIVYKKGPDYILYIGAGLLLLVILILLVAALKGGGTGAAVEVIR